MDTKKYVAFAISLILVIASVTVPFVHGLVSDEVNAGEGGGKSEKVETLDDFSDVWSSLVDLSYSLESGDFDTKTEYSSMTLSYRSRTSSVLNQASNDSTSTIDRSMEVYFDGEAAYYSLDGNIVLSEKTEGFEYITTLNFNFDAYVDPDISVIRIQDMTLDTDISGTSDEIDSLKESAEEQEKAFNDEIKEYFGKWIREETISSVLEMASSSNYAVFNIFDTYITGMNDGEYKYTEIYKDVYRLEDKAAAEMYWEMLMATGEAFGVDMTERIDDIVDGSFKVDLSDAKKPVLSSMYNIRFDYEYPYGYDAYNVYYSVYSTDEYVLSNINNTEIKSAPTEADIVEIEY